MWTCTYTHSHTSQTRHTTQVKALLPTPTTARRLRARLFLQWWPLCQPPCPPGTSKRREAMCTNALTTAVAVVHAESLNERKMWLSTKLDPENCELAWEKEVTRIAGGHSQHHTRRSCEIAWEKQNVSSQDSRGCYLRNSRVFRSLLCHTLFEQISVATLAIRGLKSATYCIHIRTICFAWHMPAELMLFFYFSLKDFIMSNCM